MGLIASLTSFSNGATSDAPAVNANFAAIRDTVNTYCLFKDIAANITVAHTWSIAQTWAAAQSIPGLTITSPGLTVSTGGLSVNSGTTAVQALTATTIVVATTATVGTFSSGNITITSGYLAYGDSVSKILSGATSFAVRNNANTTDNLLVTNAGAVTTRDALTVTTGGLTVTGNSTITGTLGGITTLTTSGTINSQTISAAASFTGTITAATGVTVTAGGLTVSAGGVTVTGNSTIAGTLGSLTGLTMASGLLLTVASASGTSGFRVPHGVAPSSPVDGDIWTTSGGGLLARINGTTRTMLTNEFSYTQVFGNYSKGTTLGSSTGALTTSTWTDLPLCGDTGGVGNTLSAPYVILNGTPIQWLFSVQVSVFSGSPTALGIRWITSGGTVIGQVYHSGVTMTTSDVLTLDVTTPYQWSTLSAGTNCKVQVFTPTASVACKMQLLSVMGKNL